MTIEERDEIVQRVLQEINNRAKSLDDLEPIDDLAKTESLPVYRKDSRELVSIPIELISKPALDAADEMKPIIEDSKANLDDLKMALRDVQDAYPRIEEVIVNAEDATSRLENIIYPLSESEYEAIEIKNPETLYVCYEDDEI